MVSASSVNNINGGQSLTDYYTYKMTRKSCQIVNLTLYIVYLQANLTLPDTLNSSKVVYE